MLIDSHCHIDDYNDLPEILHRARAAGVEALLAIGIGDGPQTMHRALELAGLHDTPALRLYGSAGIHPQEAHQADQAALAKLTGLVADSRCIAIGEIGLDYYHAANPDPDRQRDAFVAQMRIAAEAGKPITLHCRTSELASEQVKARFGHRDAAGELLDLLEEHWRPRFLPGIMHCFSGDQAMADRALEMGFFLSFAGNVTYPKSRTLQEVARHVPDDRLLVETDAPFLTPQSRRGTPNEPAFVAETAAFVASLRGVSAEQLARQTSSNFHRLFPSTAGSSQPAAASSSEAQLLTQENR